MASTPPRLLLATPDFPPDGGGIAFLMGRLAEHLPGFDVEVATYGGLVPRSRRANKAAAAALNAVVVLRGLRRRPQVLLCGHVALSPAAIALKRIARVPWALYVHADEFRTRPGLCRRAVRSADVTIAVSAYTRGLAVEAGADASRIAVVHPGVDLPDRWTARRPGPPVIVTVGRLAATHKGHDVVLEALPRIREAVPSASWVLVGGGEAPHLRTRARELGLETAVTWAGAVSDEERDRLLRSARVFVMPSRIPATGRGGEGFGIAYLEAGAHGLPVVAGDRGGAVDAVDDGVTGTLVDATDPAAVAEAVAALLRDPARAEAMGEAGRRRAERHAWPLVGERIAQELRRAL
jgi:phosphatidylinositol alpha-1,6-mannosyltransferase